MKLDLTDMLYALSFALDEVEMEILGVETGHGKRVAYLSVLMGKAAGFRREELRDFAGCCILHDNALTEFIHEELAQSSISEEMRRQLSGVINMEDMTINSRHSVIGEQNIRLMPFRTDVKDVILYHHENADGTGAMKKTAAETGLKSQILHLADMIDVRSRLSAMTEQEFEELCVWVESQCGRTFSQDAVELFQKAIDYEKVCHLDISRVVDYLKKELLEEEFDYSDEEIHHIAAMFAKIVDYKSEFTQMHSTGIAAKAEQMAHYYHFDAEKTTRYYFAAAMHDIGKLVISNDILEKPARLTNDETAVMQTHVSATYYILNQMKNIPDIIEWASNHHEKLNGTGYFRGLSADDLSFEDRLMACIDIYQALTEKRPYKDGMSHEQAIAIMQDMVRKGEIDESIVRDMDAVMSGNGAKS